MAHVMIIYCLLSRNDEAKILLYKKKAEISILAAQSRFFNRHSLDFTFNISLGYVAVLKFE